MDRENQLRKTLYYGEAMRQSSVVSRLPVTPAASTTPKVAATPPLPPAVRSPPNRARPALAARLLAITCLAAVVVGLAYAGQAGYHAIRDSFVAPIILSPDNDIVIQSKMSLGRLLVERQTLAVRIEQNGSGDDAGPGAAAGVHVSARDSLKQWQRGARTGTVAQLEAQWVELKRMAAAQDEYINQLRKHVEAGLALRADLTREENVRGELRVALLKIQNELTEKEVQQRADREALAKADELVAQLKARPIYRAIESSQNVAFVPYSQLAGVHDGDDVFECDVWGVFACHRVGRVAEVVPGEVATQDPWGTPTRGQYALLQLDDALAAQSKTLRIRPRPASPSARPPSLSAQAPAAGP